MAEALVWVLLQRLCLDGMFDLQISEDLSRLLAA